MFTCAICNREFTKLDRLSWHIHRTHKIQPQDYYDKYLIKNESEKYCPTCGCRLSGGLGGYPKHCSIKCSTLDPIVQAKFNSTMQQKYGVHWSAQSKELQDKQKQTAYERRPDDPFNAKLANKTKDSKRQLIEEEHKCTRLQTLLQKYGFVWYMKNIVPIYKYQKQSYVSNDDIPIIRDYVATYDNTKCRSNFEERIFEAVAQNYAGQIIRNSRSIIKPKELDIYLPDLKLAIECDGIYWHSYEFQGIRSAQLNKSLACREKGIRLIHIYEFEDINKQLELIIKLLNGIDDYPQNDFNKNNLIDTIPKAKLIYKDDRFSVYGAGNLN